MTIPGVVESTVRFPADDAWYDVESSMIVSKQGRKGDVHEITVPSDIDTIPVFQRGGSIIPRKLRLRRSSHTMTRDPYTLFIALDLTGSACGALYMDDETTFNHVKKAEYASAEFTADLSGSLEYVRNEVKVGTGWKSMAEEANRTIERIIVMGVAKHPSSVDEVGESLGFSHDSNTQILIIRKPQLSAMVDWEIKISFYC